MRFYIDIEIDNAAFEITPIAELQNMLRLVSEDLAYSRVDVGAFPLRDSNGNTCGVAGFARGRVKRLPRTEPVWTPEMRAAQGEKTRARHARREASRLQSSERAPYDPLG